MIADCNCHEEIQTTWQAEFAAMLPEIQERLRRAFRQLDPESRLDAIDEATIHSLLNYAQLHARGVAESASPSTLAWYATKQVKRGRPAAGRMSSREPLSRYAQIGKGIHVKRLHGKWIDEMVEDKRASVPDQVAAKLDVGAWFATLTQRMRQIAKDLALGFSTSEVAKRHGVSAGRISQLRRTLEASWATFQHDSAPASAQ